MATSNASSLVSEDELSLDRLAGEWRIWQLRRGHRFSADDLFTAWVAARAAPHALRLCDLGAGIGSVGLMTLWRMAPEATLVAVEAQLLSHSLCARTVATNGLEGRVHLRHGDLRDPASVSGTFDLVTGSPPYIPLGKGVISPVPQRAAARMELRGSIADYARTAARILAPDGTFVACFAAQDPRGEPAIADAGLHLALRQDVVFRHGQPPLISVFVARRTPTEALRPPPFFIRDALGAWTDAYLDLRQEMGTDVRHLRIATERTARR